MPRSAGFERRVLDGGVVALVSPRDEADGFLVAFTERSGGLSQAPFDSLNLGLLSGDDSTTVLANRRLVCSAVGVREFATAEQVHGAKVAVVGARRAGAGFADTGAAIRGADALTTSVRGLAVAVVAADCVPLAVVDPETGRLAVAHAGWRGIADGIVPAAVRSVGKPGEVRAAIGPAIGGDHYEVGEEVVRAVSAAAPGRRRARPKGTRLMLDLPGTVADILEDLGVREVTAAEECTACEADRFFSHRRDGRTGRQGLIAARR